MTSMTISSIATDKNNVHDSKTLKELCTGTLDQNHSFISRGDHGRFRKEGSQLLFSHLSDAHVDNPATEMFINKHATGKL